MSDLAFLNLKKYIYVLFQLDKSAKYNFSLLMT